MEGSSLDKEAFRWLSAKGIDLGRKSSFNVAKESRVFTSLAEAEFWMSLFVPLDTSPEKNLLAVSPNLGPTGEVYQECARVVHEITETAAMEKLAELLRVETNHSDLCQRGIWYWSTGHKRVALMAYNAGPGRVDAWLAEEPDPARALRYLAYGETRAYVWKVLDLVRERGFSHDVRGLLPLRRSAFRMIVP